MKKYIYAMLLFLACFNASDNVYAATTKAADQKVYFILMSSGRFKLDFQHLCQGRKIILIISHSSYSKLEQDQRKYFHSIVKTADFSVDNLFKICTDTLTQLNLNIKPDLAISTIDEWLVETVESLKANLLAYHYTPLNFKRFRDKLEMKKIAISHQVCVPKHVYFSPKIYKVYGLKYLKSIDYQIGPYPIFAKPIDSGGSYDACKICDIHKFMNWAESHKA